MPLLDRAIATRAPSTDKQNATVLPRARKVNANAEVGQTPDLDDVIKTSSAAPGAAAAGEST